MRPGGLVRSVGLSESSALQVFLTAGFNQNDWAFLGAVVNTVLCEGDRSLGQPTLVGVTLVPQNLTGFEIETRGIAATVAAIRAEQRAVVENDAAVMIFH